MRVLYLTDLHIGATADGFQQQPRNPSAPAGLIAAIAQMHAATPLGLLILGGDLTEHGSDGEIASFVTLLEALDVPALICLGNHDLATPNAHTRWQARLAGHPRLRLADSVMSLPQVQIVAINTWWANPSGPLLHWDSSTAPAAAWPPGQLAWIERQLALTPGKPAILAMHAPIFPAPTALTGLPTPIHGESDAYSVPAEELLARLPQIRLVLAGHSHINCALRQGGYVHLTTTSVIEIPFYARLLELEGSQLRITTQSLLPEHQSLRPDAEKLWALGRDEDRALTIDLAKGV